MKVSSPRWEEGRDITKDGEATAAVMSPETDYLVRVVFKRGHLWDEAIARFEAGERGEEAGEALEQIAARLNITW